MIKIVISIVFCFLIVSCTLKDDALGLNKQALNYLDKLGAYPVISHISFENGNITLSREKFKSNPSHFFGDVRNLMNERLPYDEDEYYDLSKNIKKCRKEEHIQDYIDALKDFVGHLKHSWEIEKYLKNKLGIEKKRFENTSRIAVSSKNENGQSFLRKTKFDFAVQHASLKTIKRLLKFLDRDDISFKPIVVEKELEKAKNEEKKTDKKKKKRNWVKRTAKRWF